MVATALHKTVAPSARTWLCLNARPRCCGATDAIDMVKSHEPVTIKKYADRLYDPAGGAYVTLRDLAVMIDDAEDFVVYDVKTGEDITRLVLKQIIRSQASHG